MISWSESLILLCHERQHIYRLQVLGHSHCWASYYSAYHSDASCCHLLCALVKPENLLSLKASFTLTLTFYPSCSLYLSCTFLPCYINSLGVSTLRLFSPMPFFCAPGRINASSSLLLHHFVYTTHSALTPLYARLNFPQHFHSLKLPQLNHFCIFSHVQQKVWA